MNDVSRKDEERFLILDVEGEKKVMNTKKPVSVPLGGGRSYTYTPL